MASIGNLYASLSLKSANFESGLRRASNQTQRAQRDMRGQFSNMASSASKAFTAMGAAAAGVGFGALLTKIASVNMEYQKLQGMLVTATGSQKAAASSMQMLQKFAATTPFSLNEVTEAFVRLKMIGLDPSERALKAYGNTSSAMGKNIMQYIEAVADATMGEMERLKEFNIKAKKNGDEVTFIFGDLKETIKNDAKSIEEWLMKLGETKFGTAMDLQAKTLGGALSNLGDNLSQMAVAFGEAGFAPALEEGIRSMTAMTGSMTEFAQQMGYLTGQVLGGALQVFAAIADNIDLITKAAGIAATVIASRYAVALGTTAVAAAQAFLVANRAAIGGMLAYATVAPVMGTATIAVTGLRAAAMGLLGIFGGPWGAVLAGAAAAVYWLYQKNEESKRATVEYTQKLTEAQERTAKVTEVTMQLATAKGEARAATLANAKALQEETRQLIANAKAAAMTARVRLTDKIAENNERMTQAKLMQTRTGDALAGSGQRQRIYNSGEEQIRADIMAAEETLATLRKQEYELQQMMRTSPGVDATSPAIGSVPSAGGGRTTQDKEAEARRQAQEYLADLKAEEQQLVLTGKALAVYNALRQAGVTEDSDIGKQIKAQTETNYDVKSWADDQQSLRDMQEQYTRMTQELGLNEEALALLNAERMAGSAIMSDGTILASGLNEETRKAIELYYAEKRALDARNEAAEAAKRADEERKRQMEQFGRDLAGIGIRAFDDLIKGSESFGSVFKNLLSDLGDMMLEMLVYRPLEAMMAQWSQNFFGSLMGGGGGGMGGGIGGFLGNLAMSMFGGSGAGMGIFGMANGGHAEAGKTIRVGERGPELFTPDRSGYITPNHRLQGGGTSINVTVNGSSNPEETRRHVMEGIAQAMPTITDAAYAKTMHHLSRPQMN